MQTIKVKSVEIKTGEKDNRLWTKYTITGEDGSSLSTFASNASSLKAGDVIEAEVEVKGKYTNLKSFTVSGHTAQTAPPVVTPKPTPLAVAPIGTKGNPELPHVGTGQPQRSGQEVGLWWKEVGEMIRADKASSTMANAYWLEMDRVLGLSNIPAEAVKPPVSVPTSSQSGKGREAEVDRRMLFSIIKTKLKFNTDNAALQWLLQVNKIPQERIDNEPDIVFTEMLVKYNWD